MGDRALVCFRNRKEGKHSPAVYLHWSGYAVAELLRRTHKRMQERGADLDYTAARFIGTCHEDIEGAMSLGVFNLPELPEDLASLSHGDAGFILVDIESNGSGLVWDCEAFGGYGLLVARDFYAMRAGDYRQGRKTAKLRITGAQSEYLIATR